MIINPDKISDILRETAELYILPRHNALEDHEISTKSSATDLVTQADIESEAHLERILPDLFPGSILIGEEGVSRGEHDIGVLANEERPVWVVDPVDGTRNFVNGKPEFGMMLSLNVGGRVEYGWIYNILAGEMAAVERGSGSYLDGVRMSVRKRTADCVLADLSGYIHPGFFPKDLRDAIHEAGARVSSYRSLHCSAHEYLNTAKGEADFVVMSKVNPWDHLSGTLLVEEAGGVAMNWQREPYIDYISQVGLITACDEDVWEKSFELFIKKLI